MLSSLGVQFVPRHEIVASELVRVCRAGGTIALGNWAADGFIGRFWTIMGPYLPPPPDYASPPAGWGRPEHVEQLFAEYPVQLTFERYALDFEAESAEAFIDISSTVIWARASGVGDSLRLGRLDSDRRPGLPCAVLLVARPRSVR